MLPSLRRLPSALALAAALPLLSAAHAQDEAPPTPQPVRALVVEPTALELEVGKQASLSAYVTEDGQRVEEQVFYFSRSRRTVTVDENGLLEAQQPGAAEIVVRTRRKSGERLSRSVKVTVPAPPLATLSLRDPGALYAGTSVRLVCDAIDVTGAAQEGVALVMRSSDANVAEVDAFGNLACIAPGTVMLTALEPEDGVRAELEVTVRANPVTSLAFRSVPDEARTGDVLHFAAAARDASGRPVLDVPITLSLVSEPDDALGEPASGQVKQDGRFVAETPGMYTVVASCGAASTRRTVRITPRNVGAALRQVGHGPVRDVHTSDLWVWEAADGRDYAVTGTWMGEGDAIFWDVTDPRDIREVSRVRVDARTVNDVKVSEDGRLCILSREGASDRKNGIVLVDVTNPVAPEVIGEYDDGLTGGVHNLFIHDQHVYALSAGRRYDILNISDPRAPSKVGSFELDTPGHSIHDVWVTDGVAYSSNWRDGVQIVDVGGGNAGGSPANPVKMGSYAYPSGWNHAAFPFTSQQTGKFYVIAGDEAFPTGINIKDKPTYPRGWAHFIDFTDMQNPVEVARYEVPEAGTHNLWVEDDLMYLAYYNGGVRIVDVSGELMGDLYRQGREVAYFLPNDPEGVVKNAPMTWGPQPYKGHVFLTDWNSGLWALKLERE
jgi:hypothetical protein